MLVLDKAQGLLDAGRSILEIAKELALKADTLCKAVVQAGKLHNPQKKRRERRIRKLLEQIKVTGARKMPQLP